MDVKGMNSTVKKVMVVTNIPNPYRIPLFNELHDQFNQRGIKLLIVFAASGYKRRKFELDSSEMKFDFRILKSIKFNFGNNEKTIFTYSGLNKVLSGFNPDKVIVTGFSLGTIKIWWKSLFSSVKYIIWSGAIESGYRPDSFIRKFQRKMLVKRASAFVSYGSKAKEYLIKIGARPDRIFIGINTVDTEFFRNETNKAREQLKPAGPIRLIYFGYLVPRKNVGRLIDIIEEIALTRNDFVLDILGDGDERKMLEDRVSQNGINDVVKFHGFVQKNDLPKFLAQSSCFLFQTDFDVWGLVINEAMAAGVPVLSTVNAGATFDLIEDGKTGFIVDYNNKQDVVSKLNTLLNNHQLIKQMSREAQKFIEQRASLKVSAKGFMDSILQTVD